MINVNLDFMAFQIVRNAFATAKEQKIAIVQGNFVNAIRMDLVTVR